MPRTYFDNTVERRTPSVKPIGAKLTPPFFFWIRICIPRRIQRGTEAVT